MTRLPKRPRTVTHGIAERADQVLLMAEQRTEPQRTELRRLALDLERLRLEMIDIERGDPRGTSWRDHVIGRWPLTSEGLPRAAYEALRQEFDVEPEGRSYGALRVIQGALS